PGADRTPGRIDGAAEHAAAPVQTAHDHSLHAARALGGRKGRRRGSGQDERVAAPRVRRRQTDHSRDVPVTGGGRRASVVGVEPAHREDRARRMIPARSLVAFQHRNFRLIWIGLLFSMTGSMMQNAALLWQVSLLVPPDRKGLALGLVGLVRVVPIVVFSLISGVVADAWNRRKLMLFTQTGS